MRKTIVTLIIAAMFFGVVAVSYGAEYTDVKTSNWAYEAVNAMSEKAIISGYPDGSFKSNNTITYGEFIKMALIAAIGEDVGNSETGNWAEKYYDKALDLGYFTKYDITKSDLNKKITRAHMALIISSILGDVKIDNYDDILKGITDITYKTDYEYDITKAYAMGILTGYTDKTFKPEKTLSRAEAAAVIYRLVDEDQRILPSVGVAAGEQKPIEQMITNIRSFYGSTGGLDEGLAEAETYEIDTNSSAYGMEVHENNGTRWISFPADVEKELGSRYLIKDNKVIDLMRMGYGSGMIGVGIYDSDIDITTVDYIASLDINNHMILIVNPFKKLEGRQTL